MKSTCNYIILLLISLSSFGQNNFINSAKGLGIGDCYTTQEGICSIVTNPDGVSNNKEFQVEIWMKISGTIYDFREVIRSGWDEIEGNKLTELKIQLKYKF